jgi:hypothetical protein
MIKPIYLEAYLLKKEKGEFRFKSLCKVLKQIRSIMKNLPCMKIY